MKTAPLIELRGVRQRYPGAAEEALRGIDLQVQPGEVFGIIGRSGAGKSSLVRTLHLLNRPSEGQVLLAGEDLAALPADRLRQARRQVGVIFQHFNLLASRTVFGNVALPLELAGERPAAIRERVDGLLDLVGLAALRDRYPAQISGGQKQRVGIARALASRPRVLLSDEATSALDPETTRSILALLRQIHKDLGVTIVLVTHQMQVLKQLADRVAVLDAGQVVEQGTVLEVFGQPRHAVTRSLLDDLVPQELPEPVVARIRYLLACKSQPARLLRLRFAGEASDRPLLSELVRRFGLDLNIVHGQVDEIQGRPFGALAVLARGAGEQLAAAIEHLRGAGVHVQEVPHA